jgi:hypothetical protein
VPSATIPHGRAVVETVFAVELELYVLRNGGTVWTTAGY